MKNPNNKILAGLLATFILSPFSFAATRYITETGNGSMNGSSWANAFPGDSLQATINASAPGDEVWVGCGYYVPTTGTSRSLSFAMKNGVTIYGSFIGTETSPGERSFDCGYCTVLSGEIGLPGTSDNSYHVIYNTNVNNTAVMDGFTIRDAYDNRAPTNNEGLGGGIYNAGNGPGGICSPTIRNCIIRNNTASFGAGIFNNGYGGGNANPMVSHCVISKNTALLGGGGMDNFGLSGNANPQIINCVFEGNTANDAAGAMYCWGGSGGNASPQIINSVFINNSVTAGSGGAFIADRSNGGGGSGGGSGTVNIVMKNCIVWGNTASVAGPQFFTFENATVTVTYSDINMTNQNAPHIISGAGTGNINMSPLFMNEADEDGPDNCWLTGDDGLQLTMTSPCINTGENTGVPVSDLLSDPRIINTTVDMGAYEFNGYAGTEETSHLPVFTAWPNPVNENLVLSNAQPGHYMLLNTWGQVLQTYILQENNWVSMQAYPAGIYFIVHTETGFSIKLVKK